MTVQYEDIPEQMNNDGENYGLAPGHVANGFMFVSGQLGFDKESNFPSHSKQQAINALENLDLVLKKAN
jgi:enamine deaminase RidA (YjgF/YER057c/UK114 family)